MHPAPCRPAKVARPLPRGRGGEIGIGKLITSEELASLLAVPQHVIKWHCERAGSLGKGGLFFGVFQEEGGQWLVPKRVAMRVCADWPLQHYTVRRVCELIGFSEQ